MPLMPKRVKFRKSHRGSRAGNAQRGTNVAFGDFGLQTLDRGWMTNRQIEACRIAINRSLKRKGKVWIRIFPHKSITSPSAGNPDGQGQGRRRRLGRRDPPRQHALRSRRGVRKPPPREAMRLASYKLGIRTRFVARNPHA